MNQMELEVVVSMTSLTGLGLAIVGFKMNEGFSLFYGGINLVVSGIFVSFLQGTGVYWAQSAPTTSTMLLGLVCGVVGVFKGANNIFKKDSRIIKLLEKRMEKKRKDDDDKRSGD